MSKLKVEGKVGDFCPNCKNCKAITRMHDGKNASIRIIEVDCEDPYDGMVKTLDVDSDICCSMFEMKSEKSCDKISRLQHELEMDKLRMKIYQLEKEKAAHMKGIERLKKSQEKLQNQVKNLQTINKGLTETKKSSDSWRGRYYEIRYALRKDEQLDESISCVRDIPSDVEMIEDLKKRAADSDYYKEKSELLEVKLKNANGVAESWKRDYEFVRDKFVHPVYDILYPDNLNRDINVADFLSNIKDLKIYADENKSMYEDLKYWRERCHKAETDVTTLNSKIETLKNKNTKLNQTISDQEVTIKALLITIKEMCKEDETDE